MNETVDSTVRIELSTERRITGMRLYRFTILAVLTVLFGSVTTNLAFAECTDEVELSEASCLTAMVNNFERQGFTYRLENQCSDYGAVQAQIELENNEEPREEVLTSYPLKKRILPTSGTGPVHVLRVSCCRGEGICDAQDGVTDATCEEQWNLSPASESCWNVTVTKEQHSTGIQCAIIATCGNDPDHPGGSQLIVVDFLRVSRIIAEPSGLLVH